VVDNQRVGCNPLRFQFCLDLCNCATRHGTTSPTREQQAHAVTDLHVVIHQHYLEVAEARGGCRGREIRGRDTWHTRELDRKHTAAAWFGPDRHWVSEQAT